MLFSSDKKIKFVVTGMHCVHCKASCEKAALSVSGVKKAVADPKTNSLVIKAEKSFDNTSGVITAVENCGFSAKLSE